MDIRNKFPHLQAVSIGHFTRMPGSKKYVAEASTANVRRFGRIYSDACDEGLLLYNPATGAHILVSVSREERSADNEIEAWVLKPTSESMTARLEGFEFIILND